jgi:hypothetical protein
MADNARALADALDGDPEQGEAYARALDAALVGTSTIPPVPRYEDRAESPKRNLRFADAFLARHDFVSAVRGGEDAGALELALQIVSSVAPSKALPIASSILLARPWPGLGGQVAGALARLDDPAAMAFVLAHLDMPYTAGAVATSVCGRAAPLVLARLEKSPVMDTTRAHDRGETYIVECLLTYLWRHHVDAAWPVIARLYEESLDEPVRRNAGHALAFFGDERSQKVLMRFLGSGDDLRRLFAVRAYLQQGATKALDALGGLDTLREPPQMAIVRELLDQVARNAWQTKSTIEDERYIDLALAWVKERKTKGVAQAVLDVFGKERVAAAKKRLAKTGQLPKRVQPTKPTGSEILAMRESMRRARANLERIVTELRVLGYMFVAKVPLGERADATTIAAIEKALHGPLPVSLRAAFEIIGSCDLTGTFPGQPASLKSDAFVLTDAKSALDEALEEGNGEAQVSMSIAPDIVGKAGFSGGQEAVLVPDSSLDARVIGVAGEPLFLERLREVFRWGGFPGLADARGDLGATVRRLASVCDPI